MPKCSHPECFKIVDNRLNLCKDHRSQKCAVPWCERKFIRNGRARFCDPHAGIKDLDSYITRRQTANMGHLAQGVRV